MISLNQPIFYSLPALKVSRMRKLNVTGSHSNTRVRATVRSDKLNWYFYSAWLGIELSSYWKLWFDSGSASIVQLTESATIVALRSDTSHLQIKGKV